MALGHTELASQPAQLGLAITQRRLQRLKLAITTEQVVVVALVRAKQPAGFVERAMGGIELRTHVSQRGLGTLQRRHASVEVAPQPGKRVTATGQFAFHAADDAGLLGALRIQRPDRGFQLDHADAQRGQVAFGDFELGQHAVALALQGSQPRRARFQFAIGLIESRLPAGLEPRHLRAHAQSTPSPTNQSTRQCGEQQA